MIGRAGGPSNPDIQLSGVGIQNEHCVVEMQPGSDINGDDVTVVVKPCSGARTCVNGVQISKDTPVRNGDRILCGSTHFFRVNCPKGQEDVGQTPSVDWQMAQKEVMEKDVSNDPIQAAITRLEKQVQLGNHTASGGIDSLQNFSRFFFSIWRTSRVHLIDKGRNTRNSFCN